MHMYIEQMLHKEIMQEYRGTSNHWMLLTYVIVGWQSLNLQVQVLAAPKKSMLEQCGVSH